MGRGAGQPRAPHRAQPMGPGDVWTGPPRPLLLGFQTKPIVTFLSPPVSALKAPEKGPLQTC